VTEEQAVLATVDGGRGEQACGERAERPADPMHADHVQRIVDAEAFLDDVDREVADDAGGQADQDRRRDGDEAAAGVIATSPATAPIARPSTLGRWCASRRPSSRSGQPSRRPYWW
jgi:hypothetical protein